MKEIRKLHQSLYRWFKRNKPEDYISHLERVQMKQITILYQSFKDDANELNHEIMAVIYR